MIEIVIVDDHILFSQSLEGLVNNFEDITVSKTFKNGKDFTKYLSNNSSFRPDLILLDISMPVMDGFQTMKFVQTHFPTLKVVALTMDNNEDSIIKMISSGACGYLLKSCQPNILEKAIYEVVETGMYSSHLVSSALVNNLNKSKDNRIEELSGREKEFVKWACTDKTYKEIASEMCVSPKTIDGYRDAVFHKLEVKNRIGLVLLVIKENLLEHL